MGVDVHKRVIVHRDINSYLDRTLELMQNEQSLLEKMQDHFNSCDICNNNRYTAGCPEFQKDLYRLVTSTTIPFSKRFRRWVRRGFKVNHDYHGHIRTW